MHIADRIKPASRAALRGAGARRPVGLGNWGRIDCGRGRRLCGGRRFQLLDDRGWRHAARRRVGSRLALTERGFVIYLHAPLEHLLARTRGDTNRPLLKAGDRVKKMQELLTAREPLYREVADLTVDTGALTLTAVVQNIRASLP
jgi:hypothetical protein